ncbi:hypothetical protein B0T16DRAFT_393920 [Cercophora newfieldiana]|uniref:Uncharacterized protein n=1 Tax=Cercophora newfieldiana TaxID=92897 RepID=A0AA40CLS5_9PEZI|nr:hypothetical protein B0T16DRAFT_393920 [Cercophora newfieldiana]
MAHPTATMTVPRFLPSLLLGAATAVQLASGTITLDRLYDDWSFTTAKLSPSTSPACLAAYRAPIACPETLLGLAASMRTVFKPTPADFDLTCTPSCADSVDAYLHGLITACTLPTDGAPKVLGSGNSGEYAAQPEPVHVIGWILQYTLARSCARKDNSTGTGTYCYFDQGPANNKFECSDACEMQFYASAHDYPGAGWRFNHYNLIDQTSWWEEYFVGGWERAVGCGAVERRPRYADVKAVLAEVEAKKKGTGEGEEGSVAMARLRVQFERVVRGD